MQRTGKFIRKLARVRLGYGVQQHIAELHVENLAPIAQPLSNDPYGYHLLFPFKL